MVPKIHAFTHFDADFNDSLRQQRQSTLNPSVFDTSNSEDFIGKISRQSRRVSFKGIERTVLRAYAGTFKVLQEAPLAKEVRKTEAWAN